MATDGGRTETMGEEMKQQTLGVFIFAAAVLATGRGSLAADAPPANAVEERSSAGLEEIVVTAQRREESLSKTAVAVTAIGTTQLTERSITTESDLQAAAPGFTVKTREEANSKV